MRNDTFLCYPMKDYKKTLQLIKEYSSFKTILLEEFQMGGCGFGMRRLSLIQS